ncbi:hypothetical protein JB92DRAFT_2829628 [Gautieria morchelliformis]|nr:hypothetical protein JB92DRAFT_2829628 [Gautieria morchelliformis]
MVKLTLRTGNPSKSVTRNRMDESTSNLQHHVNECSPVKLSETHALAVYANGTTHSSTHMLFLLAKWCAHNHRPFSIINDKELIQIFKMLYGRVDIPSHVTLSRDIHEVFDFSKAHVSRFLKAILSPFVAKTKNGKVTDKDVAQMLHDIEEPEDEAEVEAAEGVDADQEDADQQLLEDLLDSDIDPDISTSDLEQAQLTLGKVWTLAFASVPHK